MDEILLLTETLTETTPTMTEMEILTQINNNLVTIGNLQMLILGILVIFLIYGMFKVVGMLINIFF